MYRMFVIIRINQAKTHSSASKNGLLELSQTSKAVNVDMKTG